MTTTPLPSYAELNEALSTAQSGYQASQVHGLLCGLLCGNPETHPEWERLVLGPKKSKLVHALLQSMYEVSAKQLQEFSFEFHLLLPDDDQDIHVRTEALGLWCQGFLTGLKLTQIAIANREPGEVTDALNDIIEIAKINYEDTEENDDNEGAYLELMEYVRLAVLMIYQELRQEPRSKANDKND